MANPSGAKVIDLQSHPLWAAAQRRERQLDESMRRHPAFIGRQRGLTSGPAAQVYRTADAPA
ncbi:hypothetical protein [Mycobacterium vicinigordonae]|uniref:Uncharacterized protein n=1 Tax=Mycobacterium vicinigordonae TaxID=1719132 RepID=A0A7D6DW15_9MYCO|nr:hypothetical protein [Mycobacterium vicinigordonae]QLL05290.1 hypothetical protein H0P51_15500 [Mycobacterium vicinigordonae]